MAPTAPNARFSTPVTTNGLKSSMLGIRNLGRPLPLALLVEQTAYWGATGVPGLVRSGLSFSILRTWAIAGSAAEMSKQSSLITILPFLGVVVQSTLFGRCSGASP